ncbi:MAG: cell wall hydrolase [Solirubrobacterales bacterium]
MDGKIPSIAAAALAVALGIPLPAQAPPPSAAADARLAAEAPRRLPAINPAELRCLALNVYWEARGEPDTGRRAVAHVTLNRKGAEGFPDTICGVVHQGGRHGPCQFHWYCDDQPDTPTDADAWLDSLVVAYNALLGEPDPTGGALYFHNASLKPGWASDRVGARRIGRHVFFRLRSEELAQAAAVIADP